MTRTDTERLDFLIAHLGDIPQGIAFAPNYRAVLDAHMADWDQRITAIARKEVHPSKEGRFADAQHPQGWSDSRETIEARAKRDWS